MKRLGSWSFCLLAVLIALTGCGGSKKARKGENVILHSEYGGCRISTRHYHNTHVFIGDQYEPSLSEWLKY